MTQVRFSFEHSVPDDAYHFGERSSGELHGVVLTRPHIVNLILDLVGYDEKKDLSVSRILEPACGRGAFLGPIVERLARSARRYKRAVANLSDSILAYDIDKESVQESRKIICNILRSNGFSIDDSEVLASKWLRVGDFLNCQQNGLFQFIVGNPPYVRIEQIDSRLQAIYRSRYSTLYDRADLYIAFIEKSLGLLTADGKLSFICANRWTANRYGGPLRRFISDQFHVVWYLNLAVESAFESDVSAYPSVFVIDREKSQPTRLATICEVGSENGVTDEIGSRQFKTAVVTNPHIYKKWFVDDEPWVLTDPRQFNLLRQLEKRFQCIEAFGGTRVGIGVATGCDRVFIVNNDLDVESSRLEPLIMRRHISHGKINRSSQSVINTFESGGELVDLVKYPKLNRYLNRHGTLIRNRHVAKRNASGWFRTIDRVYPELTRRKKLLIPDIADSNQVVYENGKFHPHHNLYYIVSDSWDLEVLGALLSSRIALFFVWTYATKMRGGYLRFQAQYLRRVRLPQFDTIKSGLRTRLTSAFRDRDFVKIDELALEVYELDEMPEFDFLDTRE